MAAPDEPPPAGRLGRARARLGSSFGDRDPRVLIGASVAVLGAIVVAIVLLVASSGDGGDEGTETPAAVANAPKPVKRELGGLGLAQKADAVVISGFESSNQAAKLARESRVGGILVGPEDWFSGFKGRTLLSRLEAQGAAAGRTPPLIVARQEGGVYRSYPSLPPAEGQRQIGETASPARAREWAAQAGRGLSKAGFDLNLAPLADVSTLDSPLSDRAFSDDPELVTALTGAAARGCRESGLACAMPYFPGLGAASQDTLEGPATVGLDAASLAARDLAPFRAAIRERVPALVLSLALYSAYDPITPGALAPSVATDLLRGELDYRGVAIADDLTLGYAATSVRAPQAAVRALTAGSDMVVVSDGRQAAAARKALAEAARSGELPPERLEEAAARALALRQRFAE